MISRYNRKRVKKTKITKRNDSQNSGNDNWAYWVWGPNINGRMVPSGPMYSESEAYQLGYQKYIHGFEVKYLNTANRQKAVRILKGYELQKADAIIDDALRNTSSKLP